MGFLHANCGNCHNPQGLANSTAMYLRHDSSAATEGDEPAFATTVDQLTTIYSHKLYRIRGGSPDESAIFSRMNTRASGDLMPPIGSKVVDQDAANRIHDWIAGLP
jgi:mono/diheme cytochrome c family protein